MTEPQLGQTMDTMSAQTDAWARSVLWDEWKVQNFRSTVAVTPDEIELAAALFLDPDSTFGTIAETVTAAKAALR